MFRNDPLKMFQRTILVYFSLFFGLFVQAQTSTVAGPPPPGPVHASDGVYEKFVLIRWEPGERSRDYRLFRATSAAGASLQELTKGWQKSTWFCDYSAEKGKDYFYAVMASDGKAGSPLGAFDKGFLKKDDKVAQEESLSAVEPDRFASGRQVFVLVSEVEADSSVYTSGGAVRLRIGLRNVFDAPAPRTDVRVYLSTDNSWDFDDRLLLSKSYSGFPAAAAARLDETLTLPSDLTPGACYLLVVTAPDGLILYAKTGSTKINITTR